MKINRKIILILPDKIRKNEQESDQQRIKKFLFDKILRCSVSKIAGKKPMIRKTTLYLFRKPIAKTTAPIKNHFDFWVLMYLMTIK